MYLSNKLFRSPQPSLNLNPPDASAQQASQVGSCPVSLPALPYIPCPASSLALHLQGPEVVVTAECGIPKDASGAIDYNALALLLKDMQSLQDQADILYILFKDK